MLKLLLLLSFISSYSFAASEGFPVKFVLSQLLNFTIFAFLVFYLVRKYVPSVLKLEYSDYLENKKRAKKVYEEALQKLTETKDKIKELERKESFFQEELLAEVKKVERKMAIDLDNQKQTFKRLAQNTANLEKNHLQEKLKEEYLNKIINLCEQGSKNQNYKSSSFVERFSKERKGL